MIRNHKVIKILSQLENQEVEIRSLENFVRRVTSVFCKIQRIKS
ncbi:hypothetical protein LEP1GSC052_0993 [Leptospira kmetyi serovar Malaysia str. Bejo-Iso9]|nr:hypothetical protein LEP1GSC052_0993 [Leptospira kmetyi serovar Malaysia str. Bejo-Iso9]